MTTKDKLLLVAPPYRDFTVATNRRDLVRAAGHIPGSALVWAIGSGKLKLPNPIVAGRPGGVSLIVVLPEAERIDENPSLVEIVHMMRPHGILPYHIQPVVDDIAQVLRRPVNLPPAMTDYLDWRGLRVDRDTKHLIRRIVENSAELKSITALARSLYVSRRALGRRLMSRGLPVPSHWLQLGRLLRLATRLQNSEESIFTLSCDAGYPDGFSMSNQMQRLIGFRPSQVRECLGWEWLFESWLRREAETGGLSPSFAESMTVGGRSPERGQTTGDSAPRLESA